MHFLAEIYSWPSSWPWIPMQIFPQIRISLEPFPQLTLQVNVVCEDLHDKLKQ